MYKKLMIANTGYATIVDGYMDVLHKLCIYMDDNRVNTVDYMLDGTQCTTTIEKVVHAHYFLRAQNIIMKASFVGGDLKTDLYALETAYRHECKCRRINTSVQTLSAMFTTATF